MNSSLNLKRLGTLALTGLLVLVAGGCAGSQSDKPAPSTDTNAAIDDGLTPEPTEPTEPTLEQREQELAQREQALAEQELALREQQLAEREAAVASREKSSRASSTTPAPKSQATPASKPAATPPPEPATVTLTVPQMTALDVEMLDPLSSETSVVGERFNANLLYDVVQDGQVAIPAGSRVSGTVSEVQASKKIGGVAKLTLTFDRLRLPSGDEAPLWAVLQEMGKSQRKKDAATIGGAAAGGAVLGKILGKKTKTAAIGAVVGAAVGTAIAANNPGDPVTIDAGALLTLHLEQPVQVVIRQGTPRFADYAQNR